ncbi:MAG: DUF4129 domain-containing protein [Pyrodictiaceae archaeon]
MAIAARRILPLSVLIVLLLIIMVVTSIQAMAKEAVEDPDKIAKAYKELFAKTSMPSFDEIVKTLIGLQESKYRNLMNKTPPRREAGSLASHTVLEGGVPRHLTPVGDRLNVRNRYVALDLPDKETIIAIIQKLYALSKRMHNESLNYINNAISLLNNYLLTSDKTYLEKAIPYLNAIMDVAVRFSQASLASNIRTLLSYLAYPQENIGYLGEEGYNQSGYPMPTTRVATAHANGLKLVEGILKKHCRFIVTPSSFLVENFTNTTLLAEKAILLQKSGCDLTGRAVAKLLMLMSLASRMRLEEAMKTLSNYGLALTKAEIEKLRRLGLIIPLKQGLGYIIMYDLFGLQGVERFGILPAEPWRRVSPLNVSMGTLYPQLAKVAEKSINSGPAIESLSLYRSKYQRLARQISSLALPTLAVFAMIAIVLGASAPIAMAELAPRLKAYTKGSKSLEERMPAPFVTMPGFSLPSGARGLIIAAYWRVTHALSRVVPQGVSETHREYLVRVKNILRKENYNLYEKLTSLYEIARFGGREPPKEDAEVAQGLASRIIKNGISIKKK